MDSIIKFDSNLTGLNDLIMSIVNSPAADSVKVAALDIIKTKFGQQTYNSISNCCFNVGEDKSEEYKEDDAS